MGKKNKKNKHENMQTTSAVEDMLVAPIDEVDCKKKKKRKNKNEPLATEEVTPKSDPIKINQRKRKKGVDKCSSPPNVIDNSNQTTETEQSTEIKTINQNIENPTTDPNNKGKKKKKNKNKKKKLDQGMNNEDEEVDDTEIDKFCDDVSPEDNVQYENWIQLLEAKLKSNKNTS